MFWGFRMCIVNKYKDCLEAETAPVNKGTNSTVPSWMLLLPLTDLYPQHSAVLAPLRLTKADKGGMPC